MNVALVARQVSDKVNEGSPGSQPVSQSASQPVSQSEYVGACTNFDDVADADDGDSHVLLMILLVVVEGREEVTSMKLFIGARE